jgi:hypothetical protein
MPLRPPSTRRARARRLALGFVVAALLAVPGAPASAAQPDSYDYLQAITNWERPDPLGYGTWTEALAIFGPYGENSFSALGGGTISGTEQCTGEGTPDDAADDTFQAFTGSSRLSAGRNLQIDKRLRSARAVGTFTISWWISGGCDPSDAERGGSFTQRLALWLVATGAPTDTSDGTYATRQYEATTMLSIEGVPVNVTWSTISRTREVS